MKWIKENGTKIETNDSDETFAYCISLGWKEAKPSKAVEPKKIKVDTRGGIVLPPQRTGPIATNTPTKSGKINKRSS